MQLTVGSSLILSGVRYLCTHIETRYATQFAPEAALAMRAALLGQQNVKFVAAATGGPTFSEFEEGDVITLQVEWAVLQSTTNTLFLYTKYVVEKEKLVDGREEQSSTDQTANRPA